MIKFAVPYNGDIELVDKVIDKYDGYIESFFGNLGIDDFGGGRAQTNNIINSEEQLKTILNKLNEKGIEFNYVINNTSLMNEEFKEEYLVSFKKFIAQLMDIGVKKITLCNPFLIKYIRKEFKDIKISASVNLKARTLEEVLYLEEIGCNEATIHYDLIKNFSELKRIKSGSSMLLKIIPNDLYIMNCPWQKAHTRMQGSHSKNKDIETPYFSYYRNKCVGIRSINPEQIYMGKWISPRDIKKYMDIGYNNFKLLDRLASTSWILNVIDEYLNQDRSDNLQEILGTYGSKSNINNSVELLADEDNVYPRNKLEAVPEIGYTDNRYWFSDVHSVNCSCCKVCKSACNSSLVFPEDIRNKYIKNNRQWQSKITKIEFIRQLNTSQAQRIEYK
ncbi:MAG: U32 family peptidase [Clostridium sp.]|uniref:U32 family peptidase n=1 Tax=Clostridium sp. TaxID=1506 RepID=UPI002FCBD5E0